MRRSRADGEADQEPDVLLDVPTLKVDEINLEVEQLEARVSLEAQVLDLLKLHVGADVSLGRVSLGIKGVDAAALLKVRLDNVSAILNRVMTTIDQNPEILGDLSRRLGEAAGEVGRGTGQALPEIGQGAGAVVEEAGDDVGEAVQQVGQGAGDNAEHAGEAARDAVAQAGEGAGTTARSVGEAAGKVGGGGSPESPRMAGDPGGVSGHSNQGAAEHSGTAGKGRTAERTASPRRRVPANRRETRR